jgi:hypothetical protein
VLLVCSANGATGCGWCGGWWWGCGASAAAGHCSSDGSGWPVVVGWCAVVVTPGRRVRGLRGIG